MAQKRAIISRGTTRIARMVRNSLSTGIKRSATICSRVPIHRRSTWTCTTSATGRKTTSLKIRPTQDRRFPCPRLVRPVRPLMIRLPKSAPRLYHLRKHPRLLRPVQIQSHRTTPRRSPPCLRHLRVPLPLTLKRRRRPSRHQQRQVNLRLAATTTCTLPTAPVISTRARSSKSTNQPPIHVFFGVSVLTLPFLFF